MNTPDVFEESLTLAHFSMSLSTHMYRESHFEQDVQELANVRSLLTTYTAHRKLVFGMLKDHFDQGEVSLHDGRALALTARREPVRKCSVLSADVKKRYPELWQKSRVAVPYVQAAPPPGFWNPRPRPEYVQMPSGKDVEETVRAYEAVSMVIRGLTSEANLTVAALKKTGELNGWHGLPIRFSDGWKVGLSRMQFSGDRLAELSPEIFGLVAQYSLSDPAPRLYIRSESTDTGPELDDDGEDAGL